MPRFAYIIQKMCIPTEYLVSLARGSARLLYVYICSYIYIRCIYGVYLYGSFGGEITKYTVHIYGSGRP